MTNLNKLIAILSCFSLLMCGISFSDDQHPQQEQANDTIDIELISQAFGHFIGKNLKSPGAEFNIEGVIKGIRDGANGAPAPMSDQEYEIAMTKLQEQAFETMARENLDAANAFMQKNNLESGVIQLEPGKLQYLVLEEGNGETVEKNGTPLVHYTGKYLDGTVFGSSEEVGGPITIPLDQTIPGFSKGMLGMKEGEKRRLFIHPELGYGTLGNLPPNALLVFDIEIIKANTEEEQIIGANQGYEEDFAMLGDDDDSDMETNMPDPKDMEQDTE
jgi:peptidylprolyl isomerase